MSGSLFLIGPVTVAHEEEDTVVSIPMRHPEGEDVVTVRILGIRTRPPRPGDAGLAAGLVAAMARGWTLRWTEPVSRGLAASANAFQAMFRQWFPPHRPVPLEGPVADGGSPGGHPEARRRRAHFFSGGVDSFHSVLAHREEIDCLVYAEGADLVFQDQALRLRIRSELGAAAAELGLPLVVVGTNLGSWSRAFGSHGDFFVGTRLICIAHLLGGLFDEVMIAPSATAYLRPFPSHPLLDPLLGSEWVRIRHPPPLASRMERISQLAEAGFPLRYLRVCLEGRDYNCGSCAKCSRTQISLFLAGALDRCRAFPPGFDLDRAIQAVVESGQKAEITYLEEQIAFAVSSGTDAAVVSRLEEGAGRLRSTWIWREVAGLGEAFAREARWSRVGFECRRALFRQLLDRNPEWLAKEARRRWPDWREAVFGMLWPREKSWLIRRMLRAVFPGAIRRDRPRSAEGSDRRRD